MKRNKLKLTSAVLAITLGSAAFGAVAVELVRNWTNTDAATTTISSNTLFTDIETALSTLNDNDKHLKSLIAAINLANNENAPLTNGAVNDLITEFFTNNSVVNVRINSQINGYLDESVRGRDAIATLADVDAIETAIIDSVRDEARYVANELINTFFDEDLRGVNTIATFEHVTNRIATELGNLTILDDADVNALISAATIRGGQIAGNWDTEVDLLGGAINELHGDAVAAQAVADANASIIGDLTIAVNEANEKVEALSAALNTTFAAQGIDFTVDTTR